MFQDCDWRVRLDWRTWADEGSELLVLLSADLDLADLEQAGEELPEGAVLASGQ